jgi:hypothetical protein
MMRMMFAAAAALALAACNQGGNGPALPPVQEGAQAPSTLTPQTAPQQANITDEVRQQLIAQMDTLLDAYQQQFAASRTPVEGMADQVVALQPGTDNRWVVNLNAGTDYTFLGACDGDCTNVDIELIDMRTGGVVASDMLSDDYPVVNFTPPANGQYIARLLLQNCTVAPCYTGTRVLTQAAGSAAPK